MGRLRARLGYLPQYGLAAARRKVAVTLIASLSSLTAAPAMAQTVLAALGDSLTQGYGLPQGDGFVPQLQAWLTDRGHDVRIVNAGVSGDTTQGGLSRAAWTLTPEVEGMIVALGGNDLLRGLPPETSRANLDGILTAADEAEVPVLLVGMIAPGNYGAAFKQSFDAMYPELAEAHGALLHPDFLGALTGIEDRTGAIRDYMQGDGIHPNADGVALVVEDIGPSVEALLERIDQGQ
ncbi:MAG: arylesterase [Celeribacter sp.]|jgi:acyl-CoA thioesterase-1